MNKISKGWLTPINLMIKIYKYKYNHNLKNRKFNNLKKLSNY